MDAHKDLRLAVLIDAENIPSSYMTGIFEEIVRFGTPTYKRIYGDLSKTALASWKQVILDNALTPMQQYSYTKGKNASDSVLIIDAMDILYSGHVDGFCIVSSDSDFTRLATRLRESGKIVFGFGERKTPLPLIKACNKFIYIEILKEEPRTPAHPAHSAPGVKGRAEHVKESPVTPDRDLLVRMISESISDGADENGWVFLGALVSLLIKKSPDFDPRNYGFKKMLPLVKSLPEFEVDERKSSDKNVKNVYVRLGA
ncbi:NYN domain-containing protein [Flaviaesturariibacter aridisoli]|uniref:NYN domain-containing protein n=1 Tax=Flaviaesturariibacter aridisoli TaxID=2545761 RepID=A0A4R4E1R2_9BACT|nr:NYN domain-containing protein [Flaviaesturariibacter aridisoli]TCZ73376.1 NYN domain-containing protein [Flaviaesturariibacter aridisoli]